MGAIFFSVRNAFACTRAHKASMNMQAATCMHLMHIQRTLEKTLHPRNLVTLNGDGWAASMTQCRCRLIILPFFCANPPQRMNTVGVARAFRIWITESVNVAHPNFSCELASCARTVNAAFSKRTPRCAHPSRLPCDGRLNPGTSSVEIQHTTRVVMSPLGMRRLNLEAGCMPRWRSAPQGEMCTQGAYVPSPCRYSLSSEAQPHPWEH